MPTSARRKPIRKRRSAKKADKRLPVFPIFTVGLVILPLLLAVFLATQAPTDIVYRKSSVTTPLVTLTIPMTTVTTPEVVPGKAGARLNIPSIGVDAVILPTGLTLEGDMAVPDSVVDVGWYGLGTRPGETGSAVIAGHNYWDNEDAVFERLDQLTVGDILSVTDAKGVSTSFVVREMRMYDPAAAATEVFESAAGVHLNLITCSGAWDPATQSFSKRLVVFTDRETVSVL